MRLVELAAINLMENKKAPFTGAFFYRDWGVQCFLNRGSSKIFDHITPFSASSLLTQTYVCDVP